MCTVFSKRFRSSGCKQGFVLKIEHYVGSSKTMCFVPFKSQKTRNILYSLNIAVATTTYNPYL